jgi:hypothetical protein
MPRISGGAMAFEPDVAVFDACILYPFHLRNVMVQAAGIAAGAALVLTWNLRHFPMGELRKFGLRRETPDAFLAGLYDRVPDLTIGSLANARRNLTKTRVSAADFIDILVRQRLALLAKRARRHIADL